MRRPARLAGKMTVAKGNRIAMNPGIFTANWWKANVHMYSYTLNRFTHNGANKKLIGGIFWHLKLEVYNEKKQNPLKSPFNFGAYVPFIDVMMSYILVPTSHPQSFPVSLPHFLLPIRQYFNKLFNEKLIEINQLAKSYICQNPVYSICTQTSIELLSIQRLKRLKVLSTVLFFAQIIK